MLATSSEQPKNKDGAIKKIHWCETHKRLEIDWTETLGYPCQLIINSWEQGLSWYTALADETHQPMLFAEPGLNLIANTSSPAIQQWQATIPEDLIHNLRPFRLWGYSLLQMAKQWPEMADLLRSNPILVWLTIEHMVAHKISYGQLRELINLKQHQILQTIGLIASKSSVRTLRRIQLESYEPAMAELVRRLWRQRTIVEQLCHQKKINRQFMRLVQHLPWVAGRPLAKTLDAIDCRWQYEELIQLVTDSCRMSHDDPETRERLASARSFNTVENIHNRLMDDLNAGRQEFESRYRILLDENGEPVPFPKPPHPGTADIKPIMTPEELKSEGKQMHHCVASYIRRVQDGEYFVYHMESPQPLTIGVTVRNGIIAGEDQVKGVRNHRPEQESYNIVTSWLVNVLNG